MLICNKCQKVLNKIFFGGDTFDELFRGQKDALSNITL